MKTGRKYEMAAQQWPKRTGFSVITVRNKLLPVHLWCKGQYSTFLMAREFPLSQVVNEKVDLRCVRLQAVVDHPLELRKNITINYTYIYSFIMKYERRISEV